ncbi:hypothetical protein PIB30_054931 [Stylosanthes scabra]|uniref:Uncharacterized protein n=1 Tax=Stylosanthes scabra TaxID=79078 RepID=A0ABU6XHX0_9FABA|nr:hypothetical protein [Stylosanthes scabra]
MGALGQKFVKRVAYRLLDLLPPLDYKFKLFWLEGEDHVCGPSSSRPCTAGVILAPPLQIATPDVSMEIDSDSGDGSDGDYNSLCLRCIRNEIFYFRHLLLFQICPSLAATSIH